MVVYSLVAYTYQFFLHFQDKSFEDSNIDFEDKILAQAIVAKSSTDPYHWEEESSNSQVKIALIDLPSSPSD